MKKNSQLKVKRFRDVAEFAKIIGRKKANISEVELYLFEFDDFASESFEINKHYQNDFYELTLEISNGCAYYVDNHFTDVGGKRLSFVRPGQNQLIKKFNIGPEESSGYSLVFNSSLLPLINTSVPFKEVSNKMKYDFHPTVHLSEKDFFVFEGLFRLLYEEINLSNSIVHIIGNYIEIILLKYFQKVKPLEKPYFSKRSNLSIRFSQFIKNKKSFHLSISEIARSLNTSKSYLHEVVKENFNTTPLKLLHQQKVEYAKRSLYDESRPIAEIASELGFTDSNNFSTFFKNQTGKSPSSYRK